MLKSVFKVMFKRDQEYKTDCYSMIILLSLRYGR